MIFYPFLIWPCKSLKKTIPCSLFIKKSKIWKNLKKRFILTYKMRKMFTGAFTLFFVLLFSPFLFGDKFQDPFKENNQPIVKMQLPAAPAIKSTKEPQFNPPAITASTLPKKQPSNLLNFKPIPKALPTYTPNKYEQQYMDSLAAQAMQAAKKKKKLIESIISELSTYGLYIVLGLVAFVVIYTVRKEHRKPSAPTTPSPETPLSLDENKKDIWSDEF